MKADRGEMFGRFADLTGSKGGPQAGEEGGLAGEDTLGDP